MNIVNRLKSNKISKDGLLECLDSENPIVLYEAITCIVKDHITDKVIVDRLIQLSGALSNKHKMLGYYKVGHVSMGALLKLGIDEKIVFKEGMDKLEKDMAISFLQSAWEDQISAIKK